MVIRTIRQVFPSCRVFRENARDEDAVEKEGRDFTNMVIFCTKQQSKLTFRNPVEGDMLKTHSRKAYLMPKHEVLDEDFIGIENASIIRRNDTQELVKHHEKSALGHWSVMRFVLPAKIWESW